jgi:hypothetical protein
MADCSAVIRVIDIDEARGVPLFVVLSVAAQGNRLNRHRRSADW